jgi:nitrate/nitrite transporter NarK
MATLVAPELIMSLPSSNDLKAGHIPILFAAFMYFNISLMVWKVLGPLGVQIAKLLALDPAQKRLMAAVFLLVMTAFRMGDGAVFQLIPIRFGKKIGTIAGFVGMAGGVGGFYLASSLGVPKQLTGSYQAGFLIFAALALIAFAGLAMVKRLWRASYGSLPGLAVRI